MLQRLVAALQRQFAQQYEEESYFLAIVLTVFFRSSRVVSHNLTKGCFARTYEDEDLLSLWRGNNCQRHSRLPYASVELHIQCTMTVLSDAASGVHVNLVPPPPGASPVARIGPQSTDPSLRSWQSQPLPTPPTSDSLNRHHQHQQQNVIPTPRGVVSSITIAVTLSEPGAPRISSSSRLPPLTDWCHLTLKQALETQLGGAPFGPAGTGKIEPVKALGFQLGIFVLVLCCDATFDFQAMGRFLVGLPSWRMGLFRQSIREDSQRRQ